MSLCLRAAIARKSGDDIDFSEVGMHIFNKVLTFFVGAALDLRRLRCRRRLRNS